MSATLWDFCADAFCIPENQTVMRHSNSDTSSPDGPCMETILQNAEFLDKMAPSLQHPMRYGKISMDSHKIKGRFGEFVQPALR